MTVKERQKAEGRRQKSCRFRLWRSVLLLSAFCLLPSFTATFRPAAPTVGDSIAIDFPAPVVLDPSSDYEIVAQRGAHVVVRTFDAKPLVLSGRIGDVAFTNLIVPLRSVLKEKDPLKPAPLIAPRSEAYPRAPFVAIAIASLVAVATWTAVVLLARRDARSVVVAPVVPPAQRFRAAVLALRSDQRARWRWARLADALRDYLAATSDLGPELTTSEVVARMHSDVVARILRQGDLEKFSPWGASGDFERIADEALEVAA